MAQETSQLGKKKIDDDEIEGVRIGNPRLVVQVNEMNFTEPNWNLTELGDEVGKIYGVNYLRVRFRD